MMHLYVAVAALCVLAPSSQALEDIHGLLDAHNTRRLRYHEDNEAGSFVPLRWSPAVAQRSLEFAQELAAGCVFQHCSDCLEGENLFRSAGGPESSTPPADFVLTAWTENEEELFPAPASGLSLFV